MIGKRRIRKSERVIDFANEWVAATAAVRQAHLDALAAVGVTGRAIVAAGLFGVAPATFGPSPRGGFPGYWDLQADGRPAVVLPVLEGGALVDLVAWRTSAPEDWRLRTGHGLVLGRDAMLEAEVAGGSLRVFATPLEWLRAECKGAVVLDWTPAHVRQAFPFFDRFLVSSKALGKRLDKAMRVPKRYRIRVAP